MEYERLSICASGILALCCFVVTVKIIDKFRLNKEKYALTHRFRGFRSIVGWLHGFKPEVNTPAEKAGCKRAKENVKMVAWEKISPLKACLSVTYHLQLPVPPMFLQPSSMTLNYDSKD